MTLLNRLLCVVLSASLAVPAGAIPVSHGEGPREQAPARVEPLELPTAAVAVPAAPAADALKPSLLDVYGALPSAAARDAAAAAAAPAAASADVDAQLHALPAAAEARFKELIAAFGAPVDEGPTAELPFAVARLDRADAGAVRDLQVLAAKSGIMSKALDDSSVRLEAPMARLAQFLPRVQALPGWTVAPIVGPRSATLAAATRPAAQAVARVNADPKNGTASREVAAAAMLDKAAIAAMRSSQGPIMRVVDGVEHPLGYNPELGVTPVWKELLEYVRHPVLRVRQLRQYKRRVNEYMSELSDEDLAWSLRRFPEFEKQEGILRHSNRDLVNDWKKWGGLSLPKVTPADYEEALMSRISIRKIFKQAMDREEPTISYQATSAHELHDQMHNVAHFMGVTMQERVISIALTGNPPQESVWAAEEKRHGNIMERVYNFSRPKGWPELQEQGIAPTSPSRGARSMITNRALAEIGAGTGYLVLKSNAKKGSPADLALEGIFRDEVYHYVLMEGARRWGLGHASPWYARAAQIARWSAQMTARAVMGLPGLKRLGVNVEVAPLNQFYGLERLLTVVQHYNDNVLPNAVDAVIDERPGFSPVAIFQVAYAFLSIHKRVAAYLRTIPDEQGVRAIGKVYGSQEEFDAAVARGEHTRTKTFAVEQNPDLTADEVRELARRFPGRFSMERRVIKASEIRDMVANYRELLKSQSYWQRKKGFQRGVDKVFVSQSTGRIVDVGLARANVIERTYPEGKVIVEFPTQPSPDAQPVVTVQDSREKTLLREPLSAITMRQLGVIFADDAPAEAKKGVEALSKINEAGPDYTPAEIVQRLGAKQTYRAEPLTLIND